MQLCKLDKLLKFKIQIMHQLWVNGNQLNVNKVGLPKVEQEHFLLKAASEKKKDER